MGKEVVETESVIQTILGKTKSYSVKYLDGYYRKDLAALYRACGFTVGAEVGVLGGRHSALMLQENPGMKLYMVDPYCDYENHSNPDEKWKRKIDESQGRVKGYDYVQIVESSMDAVKKFEYNSLDFVYIDACHTFDNAMMDIIEWTRRVRRGGIVAGHDYTSRNGDRGVYDAINAYVDHHGILALYVTGYKPDTKHGDQIRSWFFVKPWKSSSK